MTAAIRLALTLVASLLMWLPTVPAALAGNESPETIALRYLLALVVARAGVGIAVRVVRAYAAPVLAELDGEAAEDGQDQAEDVDEDAASLRRRGDDEPTADVDDLSETLDDVEETTALVS